MLRRAGLGCLLILCGLGTGCSCHLTAVPPVDEDIREACTAVAVDSRCHLNLFFLRGCDPLDCADVQALKETMQALGFPRAWCGHQFHVKAFKKEIARIWHDDPKARFVLVGYGSGVDAAAELARALAAQDIGVELLFGLGRRVTCPGSVHRQVTIVPCGAKGDGREVFEVPVGKAVDLAMHPETIEMLARECFGIAGGIPSVIDLPKMYTPEHEPTPRPVMPRAAQKRDEWDFLLPALVDDRETPARSRPRGPTMKKG